MRGIRNGWLGLLLLLLLAAGCATDPYAQLETATPALTPAQVADLRSRARTPEQLGIKLELTLQSFAYTGLNELSAPSTITVPLLKIPSDNPRVPGGLRRVPVVTGTVDGKQGVDLFLDSGSSQSVLGYSLSRDLDVSIIAGSKPVTGMGFGGSEDNFPAVVPEVQIGSLRLRRLAAFIAPDVQALRLPGHLWGGRQLMILSLDALRRLSYLTVDSPRGSVTFGADGEYMTDPKSAVVTALPLRWEGGVPMVEINIDNRGMVPCIIDTGGDYGLFVPRARAVELGYWRPGQGTVNTALGGMGGAGLTTTFQVNRALLGDLLIVKIPARTQLIGPEVGHGRLLLGNAVLRRYCVTFDFRRSVVWLEE